MVGSMLQKERERQNLTIKDIEQGTSIRAVYIEAIENEDFATLPGEVYAKGFVRNYALFLGLEPDQVMEAYRSARGMEVTSSVEADSPTITTTVEQSSAELTLEERVKDSHKRQWIGMIGGLAAVAILAIGGYLLLGSNDSSSGTAHKVQTQTASKATKTTDVGQKKNDDTTTTAKDVSKGDENPKTDGIEVSGTFTDSCWIRVIADGKNVFEGTVDSGKNMSWSGKQMVKITAGNAGAVTFKYNGKSQGKAGKSGEVVDKVFTKDGIK